MKIEDILSALVNGCKTIFRENLTGVYLHGSLAFGCFHWPSSDIDFIIVTQTAPSLSQKEALIRLLLQLDECCHPKGLEMSLVLSEDCRHFRYPTPYQLHFSNAHKQRFRRSLRETCREMQGTDPDLAAHFTVIGTVGMALWGEPIDSLFAPVPAKDYLDSIQQDICCATEEICKNPVYLSLNLCRVLAYCRQGLVCSKEQGGTWGLRHLPEEYAPILELALDNYRTGSCWDWGRVSESMLERFAADMLDMLQKERQTERMVK